MKFDPPKHDDERPDKTWVSAHVCPKCGATIDLASLDLGAVTAGMVSCAKCDWAGKIEIRVVESDRLG